MMNVPVTHDEQDLQTARLSDNETDLHSDYEYLDSLIARVEVLLHQGLYEAARRHFEDGRAALEQHMLLEERTAFPIYERLAKSDALTSALKSEHESIRNLMDRTSLALRGGEAMCWDALSNLSDIQEILGPHSEKEEAFVFSQLRGLMEQNTNPVAETAHPS
jgi:iron-sulfur cluster repair protein YtfE (RIC family)